MGLDTDRKTAQLFFFYVSLTCLSALLRLWTWCGRRHLTVDRERNTPLILQVDCTQDYNNTRDCTKVGAGGILSSPSRLSQGIQIEVIFTRYQALSLLHCLHCPQALPRPLGQEHWQRHVLESSVFTILVSLTVYQKMLFFDPLTLARFFTQHSGSTSTSFLSQPTNRPFLLCLGQPLLSAVRPTPFLLTCQLVDLSENLPSQQLLQR